MSQLGERTGQQLSLSRIKTVLFATVIIAGLLAPAAPVRAAFPGANGKIAFDRYVDTGSAIDSTNHIFVMNPDGTDQVDLSGAAANRDSEPVWSADGSKIAFSSRRSGSYNIWTMNADGSGATNITKEDLTGYGQESPTWSPDGTKIAFSAKTTGGANSEIYIINADGTGLVQLTNTPAATPGGGESDPTWSPDGTKLAFAEASSCGGGRGIFVMNVDGSNRIEITSNTDTSCEDQPTWSPDGAKLAFVNGGAIWTVNADGTDPKAVATSVRSFKGVAWSPDGTKLAFANEAGNISVIGVDGTGEQELTATTEVDQLPDWAAAPAAPAAAQVVEQVKVKGNGGNPTDGFPEDLYVQVTSPPDYERDCCLDSNSGAWVGPNYEASGDSSLSGPTEIDWSVSGEATSTSSEQAAREAIFQGWPEVEAGATTIPRYEGDQLIEEIDAYFIVTHDDAEDSAYYEGAVGWYLGQDVYAAARFGLLRPSGDSAGSYGEYRVNGMKASDWQNQQLHTALENVALQGPLPKYGSSGDDEIEGSEHADEIYLGDGNDKADGDEGDDKMFGQGGNDIVAGGPGNDRIAGNSGNDKLYGDLAPGEARSATRFSAAQTEGSNDILTGGPGNDLASGGEGSDKLVGGPGLDVLKGGDGRDTCVFDSKKEVKRSSSCEKKTLNF